MTNKLLFVVRFLAVFAVLAIAGWLSDAPARYASALRVAASITSPLANGWTLEQRPSPGTQEIWFRRGNDQLRLGLSLEALALGLLPLLSLLGATPRLEPARRAACAAIGIAALFLLDLLVLLLYPFLVPSPNAPTGLWNTVSNATTDIIGTFLGLLTFVGGPVIVWFVLTFRQLRGVWRLG
jgi:hypothetical protein